MSSKNILQRHMMYIHIHYCEGEEATIDDGTAKGVIQGEKNHCDTIEEEKTHCNTNEEETATNSTAPPACTTVATSWPVTKWTLCEVTKAM